jgi:two-component system LytT family response regulator
LRVVVVDDEPLARRGVIARLENHADIEVVGEAENGIEGLRLVAKTNPDLLFLDVKMPGMGGLELAAQLKQEPVPYIIYLTAFDRYALQAFQVRALDYLLKPIDDDRFQDAVERARQFLTWREESDPKNNKSSGSGPPRQLSVRAGKRTILIRVCDIEWVDACGDYARLHIGERSYLVRESMERLIEKLDQARFLRIHRRTIIRVDQIKELVCLTNRDARIRLINGIELRVSRTFRKGLEDAITHYFRKQEG